jgi:hypothetical protein
MEDLIFTLAFGAIGFVLVINIIKWLLTAPGEFSRLLKQGPSAKLTFVFLGIGLCVFSLVLLEVLEIDFGKEPSTYFLMLGGAAGITGVLYHIFLSTKYQEVGYFFIVIFKILLVVVPTIVIFVSTKRLSLAIIYFFIMLLVTYYSVYRIKTNSDNGGSKMVGASTIQITMWKILKYSANSLFQAVLGYLVSMFLSNTFHN